MVLSSHLKTADVISTDICFMLFICLIFVFVELNLHNKRRSLIMCLVVFTTLSVISLRARISYA